MVEGAYLGRELTGAPHTFGEVQLLEYPDDVPANVYLVPLHPETCRTRVGMMIAMPVFSPCAHLNGTKPPDILAGVAIGMLAEMSEAVHEALHVHRIDQTDGADPE